MLTQLIHSTFNTSNGEHTLVLIAPSQLETELFPCLSTRTDCLLSVSPASTPDIQRAAALLRTWRSAPPEHCLLDALSLISELTGLPVDLPVCTECSEPTTSTNGLCEACGLLQLQPAPARLMDPHSTVPISTEITSTPGVQPPVQDLLRELLVPVVPPIEERDAHAPF